MKFSDLETGMWIRTADSEHYMVVESGRGELIELRGLNSDGFIELNLDDYNEDFTSSYEPDLFNITGVYQMADGEPLFSLEFDIECMECIWPLAKVEKTIPELEKALGLQSGSLRIKK